MRFASQKYCHVIFLVLNSQVKFILIFSEVSWLISWIEFNFSIKYQYQENILPYGVKWRRKWQPTPVFLPGESQGWGSLVSCCLWGRTESDTIEAT